MTILTKLSERNNKANATKRYSYVNSDKTIISLSAINTANTSACSVL